MNWSHKIIISLALFILFVVSMGVYMWSQSSQLVEEDYYEKEIQYQEEIDRLQNSKTLTQQPNISVLADKQILQIQFPSGENIKGKVEFIRPSEAKQDFEFDLQVDSKGLQEYTIANRSKGLWKAKLHWEANGTKYLNEYTLTF